MSALSFFLFRMLVGFVALAMVMVNWRVSVVLMSCILIDFAGILVSTAPPNSFFLQVLGHALLGVMLGIVVSAGVAFDRDVRRLLRFTALAMLTLTLSWCGSFETNLDLWWLYVDRVIVLPAAMHAVIVIADRHRAAKAAARHAPLREPPGG